MAMQLDDIAKLLAEKINQAHYIKHYLIKVFNSGIEKGLEDKENFAIGFAEFCRDGEKNTEFWYKEMTLEELLEIYKKRL